MAHSPSDQVDALDATWRDVEQLLEELTQFAGTAQSSKEFHELFVAHAVQSLVGLGGAVWVRDRTSPLVLDAAHGRLTAIFADESIRRAHSAIVEQELNGATSPSVPRYSLIQLGGDPGAKSAVAFVNIAGDESESCAVLEVLLDNESLSPPIRQRRALVLAAFAEVARDFHRRQRIRELKGSLQQWNTCNEMSLRLHARLDTHSMSYVIANELRGASNIDRAMVLLRRGTRLRVMAVSGMAGFDERSSLVREAQRLATGVALEDQSLWYAEGEPLDEDLALRLKPYLDHSQARAMGLITLHSFPASTDAPDRVLGVILCERFDRRPFTSAERQWLEVFCRHAAVAVGRAVDMDKLPLIGLSRGLSRLGLTTRPATKIQAILWTLAAATLIAIGGIWPVEFAIRTPGVLQPVQRREVFAPAQGVVRDIRVHHGDRVSAGDVLLVMGSDDLELELTRLHGELQTARRQLQSVQASRFDASKPTPESRLHNSQLTAEEERLKEVIQSLEAQHGQRLQQREQLTVLSPVDGQVVTWDVERLLRSRPLQRGQQLLTVADVDRNWMLELHVADADAGHVIDRWRTSNRRLPVTYRIVSEPAQTHHATLTEVADWTASQHQDRPFVRMVAPLDDNGDSPAVAGTTIAAEIHLGKRARAFVWFRELWEFIRIHVWF